MRRHRNEYRRGTGKTRTAPDRVVVGTLRPQINIAAVIAFDDVVLRLAAALVDLKDSLSPEQFTRSRSLAEDPAGTLICKGLVSR